MEREERRKRESAAEEGCLGNQEGQGWGLINGVIFQSLWEVRENHGLVHFLTDSFIDSFFFLLHSPSLLPFLPQTPSGHHFFSFIVLVVVVVVGG